MSEEEQILLPKGYKRVEFLQSTGTQYINTNYYPCAGKKYIHLDVQYIPVGDGWSGNKTIFSATEYSDSNNTNALYRCSLNFGGGEGQIYAKFFWFGGDRDDSASVSSYYYSSDTILSRNTLLIKGDTCTYGAYSLNVINGGSRKSNIPLTIFGSSSGAAFSCYKMKLYEFKMGSYENDTINVELHLIPCLDNNDKPCLYDVISKNTYYNAGSGEFLYKEEKIESEIILPERFKKLSKIITRGTQYIDTGYIPNNETGFWVNSIVDSNVAYNYLMGINENNTISSQQFIIHSATLSYGWNSRGDIWNIRTHKKRVLASLNFCNTRIGSWDYEGKVYGTSFLPALTFTPTKSIFIGAVNFGGQFSTSYASNSQIYEVKISQGTEIVRHFVPAFDTDLREACMYEVIEGKAYYSQGTGKFLYLTSELNLEIEDLPERYVKVDYLEDTGIQWINTDYVPTPNTGLWVDAQQITHNNGYPIASGENGQKDGFTCPRVLKSTTNTSGFGYGATWHNFGTGIYDVRFTSYINLYNDKKAVIEAGGTISNYVSIGVMNFTPIKTIYIFATNENGGNPPSSRFWKGRIYQAKITEGTELVRHFIPAYDTYRRQFCMYDVVNDKAYYNEGGGDFISNEKFDKPQDTQIGITHNLPKGFKRVNYLIANGGQYIDTNYVPTNETGYYVEGQGYTTSETFYFGLREDTSTDSRIYACATPNVNWGWMTYGTLTNTAANLRQETKFYHNFLNSRIAKATINETDFTYNLPDLDFNPSLNIYLFGYNYGGVPNMSYCLKGRIDTFLISEGDQIVRQFLPCLDDNDIPCMYEIYTGTVHYNQGLGNFSYPHIYNNNPINLPAGYTKCSYLQSDGTQWIDTGYIPNTDTGVSIKLQHLSYGDFIPFGAQESSSAYYYPPRFNTNSKHCVYSFGTTYQLAFVYDKGDDLIYTSTMNLYNDKTLNLISQDTIWRGINYISFGTTFTRSMWLFSYNMDNTAINATYGKFGGRIFRAKITQDTYLAHDFVPCLDENNRPCMYDLVTQTPFYNQSGGTDFTYCIEHQLPSDFIKLDYLESTGTQIIKTGYVPTDSTGIYIDAYHTKYNGDTDWSVMGLRNTNGNTYFYVGMVMRDSNGAGFGWGAITSPGGTGNVRYEATLNFLNSRKSVISAPSFVQRNNTLGTLSFTPTKDLYMFGLNNYDGAATIYSTYRIYRAKISEGTEIVRDFVPAWDNKKQKPCMYDLINAVPYYNDGEGEFVMPPKREGNYTGFTSLGGIGNRLGNIE